MTTVKNGTTEYTFSVDRSGVTLHSGDETFTVDAESLRLGMWEFDPVCELDHCSAGVYRFCYEEPCHALRGDSHS